MKINETAKIYCTRCPYFNDVIYFNDDIYEEWPWYGARCGYDGHSTMPSMYAIKSLHNNCPLTAESEDNE